MLVQPLLNSIQKSLGYSLSFLIYYGLPFHQTALKQVYAPFIRAGDLCFDLGAHLGDRVWAWSQLGARIIAIEPHPGCMRWLRRQYGSNTTVVLLEKAVGAHPGNAAFWISRLTPSISTLSYEWLTAVRRSRRF